MDVDHQDSSSFILGHRLSIQNGKKCSQDKLDIWDTRNKIYRENCTLNERRKNFNISQELSESTLVSGDV